MNRIVVYKSKSGFTEKYAAWIAEALSCEAKELQKIDVTLLSGYDQVIYGGRIVAGMVDGYNKIKALNLKNQIVFGCGMTVPSQEVHERIATQNEIPQEKLFYLEGGYDPKQTGLMGRMAIHMVAKGLEKKEEKTADDLRMIETSRGADRTDRESIKDLVKYVQSQDL